MKKILVTVSPLGKVKIEMEGYEGEHCVSVLKKILERIGRSATMTPTAEYYAGETTKIYEYE